MAKHVIITNQNFAQEVERAQKPVIVDVFATWCGPCQQVAPIFEELAEELSEHYVFASLDIDQARDIAVQFKVSSVPTFLFFKQGVLVGRTTGYMNKGAIKAKIQEFLA